MTKPFDIELPAWNKRQGHFTQKSRAMLTATPGILLTEAVEDEGRYRLTHASSKFSILAGEYAATHDVFGLFILAEALAAAGDWERSPGEIAADKGLSAAVLALVKAANIEWSGMRKSPGLNKASAAALAAASKPGEN